MGLRRKGRILSLQALYAWEISRSPLNFLLEYSWLDEERRKEYEGEAMTFSSLLTAGTIENIELIDSTIKKNLEHWDFSRVSKVDLAILRISVYALLFLTDIPPSVTIDEAVDLAKDFGTDDSYRFINGVLDGIRKEKMV